MCALRRDTRGERGYDGRGRGYDGRGRGWWICCARATRERIVNRLWRDVARSQTPTPCRFTLSRPIFCLAASCDDASASLWPACLDAASDRPSCLRTARGMRLDRLTAVAREWERPNACARMSTRRPTRQGAAPGGDRPFQERVRNRCLWRIGWPHRSFADRIHNEMERQQNVDAFLSTAALWIVVQRNMCYRDAFGFPRLGLSPPGGRRGGLIPWYWTTSKDTNRFEVQ